MINKIFVANSNKWLGFNSENLSGPNCDNGGYNVNPANDN